MEPNQLLNSTHYRYPTDDQLLVCLLGLVSIKTVDSAGAVTGACTVVFRPGFQLTVDRARAVTGSCTVEMLQTPQTKGTRQHLLLK